MTEDETIRQFEKVMAPRSAKKDLWESPYRMLAGAAYSVAVARIAERKAHNHEMPEDLPIHWWEAVKRQILTRGHQDTTEPWVHVWQASYMLTNAIFRISAATEKILSIISGKPGRGRQIFIDLKEPDSPISKALTHAHQYLRQLPLAKSIELTRKTRAAFLENTRRTFTGGKLGSALACAICQTDKDKHVSYKPLKQLPFDFAMASDGFTQACAIFAESITKTLPLKLH